MADSPVRGTFRVGGVPVVLPWSSLVGVALLTWLFAPGFSDNADTGLGRYLLAAIFAVLVYASILLHELAHAGAARSFGFPVHQIQLHALGGYTTYERRVTSPGRELAIAIAGPATTLAIAAACFAGARLTSGLLPSDSVVVEMLRQLTYVGIALGVYNLLPGIPLDGGALVKCAVWKVTGSEPKGTRVAAISGLVVAVAVFVLPFWFARRVGLEAPDLTTVVAVALFSSWLGMGALAALRSSRVQERLPLLGAATLARRAMAVPRDLPLGVALDRLAAEGAGGLVVVDADGRPVAIGNEAAIAAVPEQRRPWVTVGSVSRSIEPGATVGVGLVGEDLLVALSAHPSPEYLVVDESGAIFGVLTAGDVNDALGRP